MTLWLSEDDVESALSTNISELVFRLDAIYSGDEVWDARPRVRFDAPFANFQYMGGVVPSERVMGVKSYAAIKGSGLVGVIVLFDSETGELLSVMGCDVLGRWRTGAVSALVAKALAPSEPISFGLIGSGKQAYTHLAALTEVCQVAQTTIYSRNRERLEQFCQTVTERFGITVRPSKSIEEVVAGSNVIATVTPAKEIVLRGAWIDHPCHINAIGSNKEDQQELDSEIFKVADLIVVDDYQQARMECGDLISAVAEKVIGWDDVVSLKAVLSKKLRGVRKTGVTVFESQGVAMWDLVAANLAYSKCLEMNLGTNVFLQSEP